MGIIKTKETTLKTSELNEFHNMTLFSHEILIKLHEYFKKFSSVKIDDGVIDYDEFCHIIKRNDIELTQRIFNAMDFNVDGTLNYREFIKFLSVFINGTLDEQISLSFKLFSDKEDKIIKYETMKLILADGVKADKNLSEFFTATVIDQMITETMKQINNGDSSIKTITFDQYKEMVKKYPQMIQWLKVDLNYIQKAKGINKQKKIGCFSIGD